MQMKTQSNARRYCVSIISSHVTRYIIVKIAVCNEIGSAYISLDSRGVLSQHLCFFVFVYETYIMYLFYGSATMRVLDLIELVALT